MLSSSIPKSWTFFPTLWLSMKPFVPLLPSYGDNAIQGSKEKLAYQPAPEEAADAAPLSHSVSVLA
jgi:hypothetical protein